MACRAATVSVLVRLSAPAPGAACLVASRLEDFQFAIFHACCVAALAVHAHGEQEAKRLGRGAIEICAFGNFQQQLCFVFATTSGTLMLKPR